MQSRGVSLDTGNNDWPLGNWSERAPTVEDERRRWERTPPCLWRETDDDRADRWAADEILFSVNEASVDKHSRRHADRTEHEDRANDRDRANIEGSPQSSTEHRPISRVKHLNRVAAINISSGNEICTHSAGGSQSPCSSPTGMHWSHLQYLLRVSTPCRCSFDGSDEERESESSDLHDKRKQCVGGRNRTDVSGWEREKKKRTRAGECWLHTSTCSFWWT